MQTALDRSAFDWDVVPGPVTIRITSCGCAGSRPGEIVLDEGQLTSSPFGSRYIWGIAQHEYAHQVDFHVLDQADRDRFSRRFGADAWCYEVRGLDHDAYGCERLATLGLGVLALSCQRAAAGLAAPGRAEAPPPAPARLRNAAACGLGGTKRRTLGDASVTGCDPLSTGN